MYFKKTIVVAISVATCATVSLAGKNGGGGGVHGRRTVVNEVVPGNQQKPSKTAEKNIVATGSIVADTSKPVTTYLLTADDGATYSLKGTASEIAGLATFKDKRVQIIGKTGDFNGEKYIKIESVKEAPAKKM